MNLARGIGIPMRIDNSMLIGDYGHFARILVDMDLAEFVPEKAIIGNNCIEMDLYFKSFPDLCTSFHSVGNSVAKCKSVIGKAPPKVRPHSNEIENKPLDLTQAYKPKQPPSLHITSWADAFSDSDGEFDDYADDTIEDKWPPLQVRPRLERHVLYFSYLAYARKVLVCVLESGLLVRLVCHVSSCSLSHCLGDVVVNLKPTTDNEKQPSFANVVGREVQVVLTSSNQSLPTSKAVSNSTFICAPKLIDNQNVPTGKGNFISIRVNDAVYKERHLVGRYHMRRRWVPPIAKTSDKGKVESKPSSQIYKLKPPSSSHQLDSSQGQSSSLYVENPSEPQQKEVVTTVIDVLGSKVTTLVVVATGTVTMTSYTDHSVQETIVGKSVQNESSDLGDFNAIWGAHEKFGGGPPISSACTDFQHAVEATCLLPIDMQGTFFTWGRHGTRGVNVSEDATIRSHIMNHYISLFSADKTPLQGADAVDKFHPIMLENFRLKVVSKILADWLTGITSKIVSKNQAPSCQFPPENLSSPFHLLYADDMLLLCQIVNLDKSNVYFRSGVSHSRQAKILANFGINAGSLPFTYLGVPLLKEALLSFCATFPQLTMCIEEVVITMDRSDERVWVHSILGSISCRDVYLYLSTTATPSVCAKYLWKHFIPPACSVFSWRLLLRSLGVASYVPRAPQITNGAFKGCSGLEVTVVISSLEEVSLKAFYDTYFGGRKFPLNNYDILEVYTRTTCEDDEDIVKFVLLYHLEIVILSKERSTPVLIERVNMLDDIEYFLMYSWGTLSYHTTIKSIRSCLTIRLRGYKTIPSLAKAFGSNLRHLDAPNPLKDKLDVDVNTNKVHSVSDKTGAKKNDAMKRGRRYSLPSTYTPLLKHISNCLLHLQSVPLRVMHTVHILIPRVRAKLEGIYSDIRKKLACGRRKKRAAKTIETPYDCQSLHRKMIRTLPIFDSVTFDQYCPVANDMRISWTRVPMTKP
ncbi:hypothetical protein FNV43_RR04578 [Rhamnella rubrinervis]|uniref:DUF1985 domain-containing protein n=1 Tax=Rhamnella rubrinervis TaxID=2594499 RepID=A0A8K0MPP4_9ROSA|nr:hypothetical protein FNV43_RR04578 [Rhamnella rubrinervis]